MKKPTTVDRAAVDLAALGRLRTARARREYVARRPPPRPGAALRRIDAAVVQAVRVDVRRAAALADAALEIAREAGARADAVARGYALRAKANALYAQAKHGASIGYHRRAVAAFARGGDEPEVARTLSASMLPLLLTGAHDQALAAAAEARELFRRHGERRRLARLEINVGNVLYRQDRLAEALACYQRAYRGLAASGGRRDVEGVAAALSNIAVSSIGLDAFRRALSAYRRARAWCVRHRLPLLVFQADYNIAYLFYLRGEYHRAIQGLHAARAACARNHDAYHAALCDLDLSEIYLELNLGAEAAELAASAERRFIRLRLGYEAAKALANRAIALGRAGEGLRALEMFRQARAAFVAEKNRVWPWLTDLYQALLLYQEGRHFEARRLAETALAFFTGAGLAGKVVLAQLLLARIDLALGEIAAARAHARAAVRRLAETASPALRHQTHLVMAQIALAAGMPAAAYRHGQAAREALERLRGGLRGEELKMAFMRNKVEVYEMLVDLCLEGRGRPGARGDEEAFGYMERAKSRTLLESLYQGPSPAAAAPGQSALARRLRETREELNWYYHRIEAESLSLDFSRRKVGELQARARAREEALTRMLRQQPRNARRGGTLEANGAALPDPRAIRAAVPSDALLLEYFRAGDRLLVALVGRERLEIVPLTLLSRVREKLRLLRFQLAKAALGPVYTEKFSAGWLAATRGHLEELYGELIAPVRERLRARHLVIVPHDVLHYLPFAALFDGQRHLIDDFTLTGAPSAAVYAHCRSQGPAPMARRALVLGAADRQAPWIAAEARAVASMVPGAELLLGARASARALRIRGGRTRWLHIAAHGTVRFDNPMFSSLQLGGGQLNLYDLRQLRLPAELAVLSGCATGLDQVAEGDELVGLMRGFFTAGVRTLLLTLWDVNDRSTAQFMRSFYTHVGQGLNKAAALQRAVWDLRQEYPHPYYWAPFVLVGAG